ncbi:MBL fold metallo-hydrolase [Candidatus Woesebacteria bacterium]|nr:MBL fold metallo-hydrolase [Candidatus Woesebacteria bacterium]
MNKVKILVKGYAKKFGKGWIATCNTTLIQTEKHNIIVDPGINKKLLLENLKKENLKISDIDYVFLTHYHPDHVFLAALFDKAKVFDGDIIYENDKETPYSGKLPDTDIEVILTPGHAHEHASLIVNTERGTIVIAADVFWWSDQEIQKTKSAEILISRKDPFTKDWQALKKSRKQVLKIADWIIPGHGKMFKNPQKIYTASKA